MGAIVSLGTQLSWKKPSATEYEVVIDITNFPDLGGEPNQHDVSTLKDWTKVSINGRQEMDALSFNYFVGSDNGANFRATKLVENEDLDYRLSIGKDGSALVYEWKGQHTTWTLGADGDAPVEATISIAPSTALEIQPVSPAGQSANITPDVVDEKDSRSKK